MIFGGAGEPATCPPFRAARNDCIGSLITGQVDHTGVGVTFDTTKQVLDQKAQGQADIFCTTGGVNGCPTSGNLLIC